MAGVMSVEKACGQILFCLKTSNLNYMVKETPFSAYVTIRKKFVKNLQSVETVIENVAQPDIDENNRRLNKEIALLQKKVKDILTENAHLRFDLEEYEIKFNALEKENTTLEIKLDEADTKTQKVEKDLENSLIASKKFKQQINENKSLNSEIMKAEKILKDKSDIVDILENTLRNKDLEIMSLTEELEALRKLQFFCIFCDHKTESESDLNNHVRKMHEEKCNTCDLAFESKNKMRDHTCKIYIHNPTYGNCYLKNWIKANGCTPIYNKATKSEIVTLHFEDCWRKISPCSELKPLNQIDSNDVFHCKVSRFIRNGRVNWSDLMIELHG